MARRRTMTAADYAALAICPALIVLMITALVHFLILCIYRGEYSLRITYIMFMFIVGATGIARISIEFGRAHASVYAGALGLATLLVVGQFAGILFGGFLIALVWLLADRITYDCTVIDDARAASGEGLIGSGGLFGRRRSPQEAVDVSADGTTSATAPRGDQPIDSRALPRRRRRGHKPGSTVFYLALAALPLFGIGQFLLPADPAVRRGATIALAIYLFATLTLLVITSFLGLRRYLRQRGVDMPSDVAVAWMAGGAALTAVMLAICFALPQPGRMLAAIDLPWTVTTPDALRSSRFGWGSEGTERPDDADDARGPVDPEASSGGARTDQGQPGQSEQGQGQQGQSQQGQSQQGQSQQGQSQQGQSQQGQSQQGQSQQGQGQQGQSQQGQSQQGQSQQGQSQQGQSQQGQSQQGQSQQTEAASDDASAADRRAENEAEAQDESPDASGNDRAAQHSGDASPSSASPSAGPWQPPSLPALGALIKFLLVAVLVGVVLLFLIVHGAAIRRLLADWLAMFGRRDQPPAVSETAAAAAAAAPVLRSFASFRNPLADGHDPQRAVVITFQALDAWARQHGQARGEDETPAEFARRLAAQQPSLRSAVVQMADAYNRVVYGGARATASDLKAAGQLWRGMQADPPPAAAAEQTVSDLTTSQ